MRTYLTKGAGRRTILFAVAIAATAMARADGTWTTKRAMPAVRGLHTATASGGLLYVMGGCNGSCVSSTEFPDPVVYSPATDSWSPLGALPRARKNHTAAAVDGRIYLFGGDDNRQTLGAVDVYDTGSGTWSTLAWPMPAPRSFARAAALDDDVYVTGGGGGSRRVDILQTSTGDWSRGPDMLTARSGHGAAAVNGKIYVMGGSDVNDGHQWPQPLAAVEELDPSTGAWVRKTDMPSPRLGFASAVVNGVIYLVGGYIQSGTNAPYDIAPSMLAYDPASDTWTTDLPDMPTRRGEPKAVEIDGVMYVTGGGNVLSQPFTWFDTTEAFAPGAQAITIDIKPDDFPNRLNPSGRGRVPVAILTTPQFDAHAVDVSSVGVGPGRAPAVASAFEDVDGDGDLDLVLHFSTPETGIVCGASAASLSGVTTGGLPIEGSDSVQTVGCR